LGLGASPSAINAKTIGKKTKGERIKEYEGWTPLFVAALRGKS